MRVFLALLLLTTSCFAQDRVQVLASAIARAEGFGKAGTIPSRYKNPGDLKVVKNYRYPGQIGVGKGGHVIFRNDAAGWAALEHQIEKIMDGTSRYNVNMTLKEISKRYAGNWRIWTKNVAHNLGVEPSTALWEILGVPPALESKWFTS
jgi:hypothetical protein